MSSISFMSYTKAVMKKYQAGALTESATAPCVPHLPHGNILPKWKGVSLGPEWVAIVVSVVGVLLGRLDRREDKLQQRTDLLEPLLALHRLVGEWIRFAEATNNALRKWLTATTHQERTEALYVLAFARHAQADFAVTEMLEKYGYRYKGPMWSGAEYQPMPAWGEEYEERPGGEVSSEHHDKLTIRDLFAIYAPDLDEQFRQVADVRIEQLESLRSSLASLQEYPETADKRWKVAAASGHLRDAIDTWTGSYNASIDHVSEQDFQDLERSKDSLVELQRKLGSFISEHWDLKDITIRSSSFREL